MAYAQACMHKPCIMAAPPYRRMPCDEELPKSAALASDPICLTSQHSTKVPGTCETGGRGTPEDVVGAAQAMCRVHGRLHLAGRVRKHVRAGACARARALPTARGEALAARRVARRRARTGGLATCLLLGSGNRTRRPSYMGDRLRSAPAGLHLHPQRTALAGAPGTRAGGRTGGRAVRIARVHEQLRGAPQHARAAGRLQLLRQRDHALQRRVALR